MAITKTQASSIWTLRQAKWINKLFGEIAAASAASASFTIGAEATNVINVAVALLDGAGTALASLHGVSVFLSDASTGIGIAATAPDGGIAIGTDGAILDATVADKALWAQSEADGTFDFDIEESGVATWYLVVQLPDGKQIVSDAITFA